MVKLPSYVEAWDSQLLPDYAPEYYNFIIHALILFLHTMNLFFFDALFLIIFVFNT